MTDPAGCTPTAEGSLAKTPLCHLLVYVADRVLSGSLRLLSEMPGEPPIEHVVYFETGAPAKVRTGEPVAYLGRVLFELGLIDERTLDDSLLEIAKTRELHGAYLVRAGAIDEAALTIGLKTQAARKLGYLFQLPADTRYSFYADVNQLDRWGGSELVPLDPLPLIWSAVRTQPDERIANATLGRLGPATLRMHPDSDASRFGFNAAELAVVDLIRASPQPFETLLRSEVAPERTVRLVVYTLLIARHLDHGAGAIPVGLMHMPTSTRIRAAPAHAGVAIARVRLRSMQVAPASPAPPPARTLAPAEPTPRETASAEAPAPLTPELAARRDEVLERAKSVDHEDYFAMLGVDRDAPENVVRAAYFKLAKIWHPDRLPPELADAKEGASKVFARMNEAFETLSDPRRRANYVEVLKGGEGTPEEAEAIQRIVGATTDFQRAEVFFRKHDLPNALEHVKRAYDADPEQPDYAALYALVLLAQRTHPDDPFDDCLQMLERAIGPESRCERAYFARASVRKRMGDLEGAMADFRQVLELNARNLDAARELRLHEMRRSKRPESPAPAASSKASRAASKAPAAPSASGKGGVLSGLGKLFKR